MTSPQIYSLAIRLTGIFCGQLSSFYSMMRFFNLLSINEKNVALMRHVFVFPVAVVCNVVWICIFAGKKIAHFCGLFLVSFAQNSLGCVRAIQAFAASDVIRVLSGNKQVFLFLTQRKGQLALALLIWCQGESRSHECAPGIRSTGCHSSPVVKQAVALLSGLKRKGQLALALLIWCPEEDSNIHTLRHTDLNRARLPIPPSGQAMILAEGAHFNCMRRNCQ